MINDVKIGIKLIKSELVRSKVINRLYVNLLIYSCLLQKAKQKEKKITKFLPQDEPKLEREIRDLFYPFMKRVISFLVVV